MPVLRTTALVCSVRVHGENGAVARLLTPDHGIIAGYVQGARSRALRPVLIPGNAVEAEFRARTADQLASLTIELKNSRGPWLGEPLCNAALGWVTSITAALLQERVTYPDVYSSLSALIDAICHAPSARGWAGALVRYELLLIDRLGFGLDLGRCVSTGLTEDLAFVSPRSAHAVSAAAAVGYEDRLMRLPPFLVKGGRPDWPDILDGLHLTGYFLERHLFADRHHDMMVARNLLTDRLKRAIA